MLKDRKWNKNLDKSLAQSSAFHISYLCWLFFTITINKPVRILPENSLFKWKFLSICSVCVGGKVNRVSDNLLRDLFNHYFDGVSNNKPIKFAKKAAQIECLSTK